MLGGGSNSYGRLPGINRKKAEVTGKPTSHDPFGYFSRQLQPILENKKAQAVHLEHLNLPRNHMMAGASSRRSVVTELSADNGILFLDNGDRLRNPVN